MAAEPEDPKAGDDEERRGNRDRRRPPLTIDLTAAPAPKGSGPASEPPPAADARAPRPSPRETVARLFPTFADFSSASISRETWIGLGSAAALGGVVALVLVMILQAAGMLPTPGAEAARQAAAAARTASDSIASIDRRLTAVEAMAEGLTGLRADLTATTGRVAALEQTASASTAKADVEALKTDVAAIKARLAQAPAAATAADLAALSARLGQIELMATGAIAPPAPASPPPANTTDLDARIAGLSSRLDVDEATIARLSTTSASSAAAARGAALAALRGAVDAGTPFTAQLGVLASFGADPVTSGLKPFAATGIATRDALRTDFGKVSDAILAATQGPGDDSLLGRIASGARGLVSIRPAGPVAGNDPAAIVSRMTADVAMGDLAKALGERDGLPAAGKDASADWAARATQRLTADTLLAGPATTAAPAGNG